MITKSSIKLHPELEGFDAPPSHSVRDQLVTWLSNLRYISALQPDPSAPEITWNVSSAGAYWKIYLSTTHESFYCLTENEVMDWLEHHYSAQ